MFYDRDVTRQECYMTGMLPDMDASCWGSYKTRMLEDRNVTRPGCYTIGMLHVEDVRQTFTNCTSWFNQSSYMQT